MKTKKIALAILSVLMLFGLLMTTVNATSFPNLPSEEVTMTLTGSPEGYWPGTATLSSVPSGYDVQNGPYKAWCSQFYEYISYASIQSYQVTLVSSIGLGTPWDKINYLLNHNTGQDMDLQVAIWLLFNVNPDDIKEEYGDQVSTDAQAMFNDANSNGAGFVPSTGQLVAVNVVTEHSYQGDTQDLIIQLNCKFEGLTPGYWKNHQNKWPSPYTTETSVNSEFTEYTGSATLLQALQFKGGSSIDGAKQILLRAAVAALLNSASLEYPLTTDQIKNDVNAALSSNSRGTILTLAAELDSYNNLGVS